MPKIEKDNNPLVLTTNMKPIADQVSAINQLVSNVKQGVKSQVLLGATGTGKTFTIANVIERLQSKTLVIVHNKTLAAQLYGEFKELFKNNRVEYFISYFDFYQPEAYKPAMDLYIEKNAQRNEDIEMMRLSTINSLATANKVIVIASVAAIYASVSPYDYDEFKLLIKKGEKINYKQFQYELVKLQYERNQIDLKPGTFRINGDVIEIAPGISDAYIVRISLFGDEIESIHLVDALTGSVLKKHIHAAAWCFGWLDSCAVWSPGLFTCLILRLYHLPVPAYRPKRSQTFYNWAGGTDRSRILRSRGADCLKW